MNLWIALAALAYAIPPQFTLARMFRRAHPICIPAAIVTVLAVTALWPVGLAYRRR